MNLISNIDSHTGHGNHDEEDYSPNGNIKSFSTCIVLKLRFEFIAGSKKWFNIVGISHHGYANEY